MSGPDEHTPLHDPVSDERTAAVRGPADLTGLATRTEPERLLTMLRGSGWEDVGYRENSYIRLRRSDEPDSRGTSVIVPLNRAANDFNLLMAAALGTIRRLWPSVWQRSIEPLVGLEAADVFDFHKETSAPRGLIAWNDGSELIESARRTLIAGAKSHIEPSRHFSNRFGQFANRYLDQILMGQSRTGSYIVTALAPAEAKVPIRKTADGTLGLDGIDVARARDVTSSVVQALEAATEAIDHFKSSGSMTGFDERVNSGVSYELVVALRDIAGGADESDITVQLAPMDQALFDDPASTTHRFEFSGGDTSVLERASVQLSTPAQAERVVVEGRVHLLTKKEAGGPGIVGVDDGGHRYRVRLGSDEEYHRAVMAHDEDSSIAVEGDLSREGSLRWLYGAQLRTTQRGARSNRPATLDHQMELDVSGAGSGEKPPMSDTRPES